MSKLEEAYEKWDILDEQINDIEKKAGIIGNQRVYDDKDFRKLMDLRRERDKVEKEIELLRKELIK